MTVGHPTCPTYLRLGSARIEHLALDQRELIKNRKYARVCRENDGTFIPLAFETYGTFSKRTEDLIKRIVDIAAGIHHCNYSTMLNYWRRRFSSTLQYFNTQIITESYLLNFITENEGQLERDFYDGLHYGFI